MKRLLGGEGVDHVVTAEGDFGEGVVVLGHHVEADRLAIGQVLRDQGERLFSEQSCTDDKSRKPKQGPETAPILILIFLTLAKLVTSGRNLQRTSCKILPESFKTVFKILTKILSKTSHQDSYQDPYQHSYKGSRQDSDQHSYSDCYKDSST